MAEQPHTTKDFELPVGLYKDGTLYKRGTMRASIANDTLEVFRDNEYQSVLAKIKGGTMKISMQNATALSGGNLPTDDHDGTIELDPVTMQNMAVLQIQRAVVLMPLLIMSMEGIERKAPDMPVLNRKDIRNMHETDITYLMNFKQEMDKEAGLVGKGESGDPLP